MSVADAESRQKRIAQCESAFDAAVESVLKCNHCKQPGVIRGGKSGGVACLNLEHGGIRLFSDLGLTAVVADVLNARASKKKLQASGIMGPGDVTGKHIAKLIAQRFKQHFVSARELGLWRNRAPSL